MTAESSIAYRILFESSETTSTHHSIHQREKPMPFEPEELQFVECGGKQGGAYLQSINKYDLRTLSKQEWITFCACVCENYHMAQIEHYAKKYEALKKEREEGNYIPW